MKKIMNIDKIISESIEYYLINEVWYKPNTWFNKYSQYQEPTPEEIAHREEVNRLQSIRREEIKEYNGKLQEIYQDITKGKETRLLDVGDKQGNQAYSLFESFILGLMNINEYYVSYGNIDSSYNYWQDKINTIINMLNFIHNNPRLNDLANKIDDDIKWCVKYYQHINEILNI